MNLAELARVPLAGTIVSGSGVETRLVKKYCMGLQVGNWVDGKSKIVRPPASRKVPVRFP